MFCSNCGKEVKDSSKFCPNCGAKIIKVGDFEKIVSGEVQIEAQDAEAVEYSEHTEEIPKTTSNNNITIGILCCIFCICVSYYLYSKALYNVPKCDNTGVKSLVKEEFRNAAINEFYFSSGTPSLENIKQLGYDKDLNEYYCQADIKVSDYTTEPQSGFESLLRKDNSSYIEYKVSKNDAHKIEISSKVRVMKNPENYFRVIRGYGN